MQVCWPAVGATVLPHIGGWANGFFYREQRQKWYPSLIRPKWCPPGWVFAPVWTGLYTSMGYASYLVWKEGGGFHGSAHGPLTLYASQLALNWAWPSIFFGAHKLKWSFLESSLLLVNVAVCGYTFYQIDPRAGLLIAPYVAWLTLATAISYRIYKDNSKIKEL